MLLSFEHRGMSALDKTSAPSCAYCESDLCPCEHTAALRPLIGSSRLSPEGLNGGSAGADYELTITDDDKRYECIAESGVSAYSQVCNLDQLSELALL
jgi:hypothetical protein